MTNARTKQPGDMWHESRRAGHVRRGVLAAITLLLLLGAGATLFFFEVVHPVRQLANPGWLYPCTERDTATRKKIRATCHKILRRRKGYHHDAFFALEHAGDKSSITYLIRALKWQVEKEGPVISGSPISCTFGHCVASLEKLTGMKLGADHEAWEKWWEHTGQHMDFDESKGQLVHE